MTRTTTTAIASDDRLLTAADVAEILGYSTTHVWRLVRRGDIDHIRINGRIRFHRAQVDAYIAAFAR